MIPRIPRTGRGVDMARPKAQPLRTVAQCRCARLPGCVIWLVLRGRRRALDHKSSTSRDSSVTSAGQRPQRLTFARTVTRRYRFKSC
jgi:hypothetical protein